MAGSAAVPASPSLLRTGFSLRPLPLQSWVRCWQLCWSPGVSGTARRSQDPPPAPQLGECPPTTCQPPELSQLVPTEPTSSSRLVLGSSRCVRLCEPAQLQVLAPSLLRLTRGSGPGLPPGCPHGAAALGKGTDFPLSGGCKSRTRAPLGLGAGEGPTWYLLCV